MCTRNGRKKRRRRKKLDLKKEGDVRHCEQLRVAGADFIFGFAGFIQYKNQSYFNILVGTK
jgi:hypothetical protein